MPGIHLAACSGVHGWVDTGDKPRHDRRGWLLRRCNSAEGGTPSMSNGEHKWLVETEWLASHLDTPGLVILDGSMHLPTAKRNARAEYLAEHIPGALFFDIEDIADETSALPHMLPSADKFASRMKKMGIGDGMHV